MRPIIGLGCLLLVSIVVADVTARKPDGAKFYIYQDAGSRENHYIPSGWMGSYRSLKMTQSWSSNPHSGRTCIQIKYDVTKDTETLWTGVYWQNPAMNWGDKKGGYDLSAYKKLTFWARGENGQEAIDKFGMGGISGQTQDGDSGQAETDRIDLTKEWKQYTIDLSDVDRKEIIGGFVFAASSDNNPKTVTFYLDDIIYEK